VCLSSATALYTKSFEYRVVVSEIVLPNIMPKSNYCGKLCKWQHF
jgi:hypothetical protein